MLDGSKSSIEISIHALLAESDDTSSLMQCQAKFLSTLSLRRATQLALCPLHHQQHFYPRSPCGERPVLGIQHRVGEYISIHALLAESDFANFEGFYWWVISIHALLAESDLRVVDGSKSSIEISIHALLAESDYRGRYSLRHSAQFLSTLSLRRATLHPGYCALIHSFLSTLSLRRATAPSPPRQEF